MPEHSAATVRSAPTCARPVPESDFLLSNAYLSLRAKRPSMTALQVVHENGDRLGYIGVDFDLRDLPVTAAHYEESDAWRQIKGDPAIRSTVFQQRRVDSLMDRNMDTAMAILEELFIARGMFQYRDPLLQQPRHHLVHGRPVPLPHPRSRGTERPGHLHALSGARLWPADALIPQQKIGSILDGMRLLRTADETLYLRSSSINIFNGMISLTFSCDGSHYMSWREFLDKDMSFWVGSAA